MSQKYKYDALNNDDNAEDKSIEHHAEASAVRNICFVQPDGKKTFLNYAYLVSGEYSPDDSTIKLTFTTHIVTLKGNNFEELFDALNKHEPKTIIAVDKRYSEIGEGKNTVTSILIEKE